jgi:hypothetical protein
MDGSPVKYSSLCITIVFILGAVVGVFSGPLQDVKSQLFTIGISSVIFHLTHAIKYSRIK